MATVETAYTGGLRTQAVHVQSGNQIITDAPTDNNGKGEAFSPTDLLAASLGSCMLTIMGITGNAHNIDIDDTKIAVTKIMAAEPRRVSEIQISFKFPKTYTEKEQAILERAAMTCPVFYSLHPDLKKTIDFGW